MTALADRTYGAAGRIRPAQRAPLDTGPLEPTAGAELPSETLLRDRANER
jgi:hypothetical protein